VITDPVFCRHCEHAVRPDGQGGWVHYFDDGHGGGYTCRDNAGVLLSTSAAPDPPPAQPSRPPDWPMFNPYR